VEMCWSYNRQHGTKCIAAMPTNLYGQGENYDLKTSHVLPALIRKFHEAKESGRPEVEIWGTGKPLREFLYSDDAAEACVFLMNLPDDKFNAICGNAKQPPLINIGCGEDQTIRALAEMVAGVVGFKGRLRFDTSKPDGTPKKQLEVSKLNALGWRPKTPLGEGLKLAYQQFLLTGCGGP
jgi:GDP-L-fucose synthase